MSKQIEKLIIFALIIGIIGSLVAGCGKAEVSKELDMLILGSKIN